MDTVKWDGLLSFDPRVFKAVGFKLTGETSIQYGVGLGIRRIYWVGESIREVRHRNHPPCLRNQLFTMSVYASLGLVGMSDPVSIYLQYLYLRKGRILESMSDQQGRSEGGPCLVETLLAQILCSYCSHIFLRSAEIAHEIRCGGRGQSCHKMCSYG